MNDKTMPQAVANAFLTLTREDSTPEESEARMFLMHTFALAYAAQTPPRSDDNAKHVRVLRQVMWCATTEESDALDAAIAALAARDGEKGK